MAVQVRESKVSRLAQLIEHDIRRKGLGVGQPYMTADSVAELHDVHVRMANRAMSLLAQSGVLVRRRGAGTFVGPTMADESPVKSRLVHVVISRHRLHAGFPTSPLMRVANRMLPECDIQWNVLPPHQAEGYVSQLIDKALAEDTLEGLILVGCTRTIQEAVHARDVPAVVFGGVYSSAPSLLSIDHDQYEIGRQLATQLAELGQKKIGVLMQENRLPGDDRFMDGVTQALADASLPIGALFTRSLPIDPRAATDDVRRILLADVPPTALICRNALFADVVGAVAEELGLQVGRDIEVAYDGTDQVSVRLPVQTCVRSELDLDAEANRVLGLLQRVVKEPGVKVGREVIPVRLARGENGTPS